MSTQQDIYAVGSENCPSMLNKENYVPWSSRLLRYAKSRPNGKLIDNFIMNGPYVRRMIPEPGDADSKVPVNETFHEQTDDELTENELKQVEADDQAIQTILLGLPEDIYDVVDSCETAKEIWLRVQQMMKGFDIGIHENKAKLFNEWERFTSTDGESIESYYHHFSKLMNDFKRNKHFLEKIASNLKFLNNLQPKGLPKIDKTHALSKPITSNLVPTPQESKVVNNDKVIALGMFRINPFKPSREEKLFIMQFRIRAFRMLEIRIGLLLFWGLLIRIRMGMRIGYILLGIASQTKKRGAAYLPSDSLLISKKESMNSTPS
ncbi:hypothetical protein Tco_1136478 [Tanacetum coccineum]